MSGYTPGETAALKGLFDMFDRDSSGYVATADLEDILEKVGRDPIEGMYFHSNSSSSCSMKATGGRESDDELSGHP